MHKGRFQCQTRVACAYSCLMKLIARSPGRNKTRKLVGARYYWPKMIADIDRYVANCRICCRARAPRDPAPTITNPAKAMAAHLRYFPVDKNGFDAVFVVVDRLGKRAISIPCYRTSTTRDMARMFITHVYRHRGRDCGF